MDTLRVKIWVAQPDGEFGHGHIQIMQEIARTGSILAASKALQMSYKKTWSKKSNIEHILGGDIFITQAGRSENSGTKLSPRAQEIAEAFAKLESDINSYAAQRYEEILKPLLKKEENEARF